jgi:glycosyltransferase involved in cell wall biosynthesis
LKKPRVLIVGAFPDASSGIVGGVVTVCRNLLQSTLPHRFELVLIDSTQKTNPPPGFFTRARFAGGRVVAFLKALALSRPKAVVLFCSEGGSLLEKSVMARISRMAGVPSLIFPRAGAIMERASVSKFERLWIRWALRGADHCLCQGPTWQRFATEMVGFEANHAPMVPNGTATERLLSIGRNRAPAPDGHVPQLLFLGWLMREKGIFELLEACSTLSEQHAFRVVIAGRGHAEEAARKYVAGADLAARVHFAGWVTGNTLEELLSESDVLVLPSWSEGLPNAMIEAMAAGLACVVTSVGNVPDVVTDGREALLVPPKRVDALQTAIQHLLDEPDARSAIAARGHEFVQRNYAVEPAVEILAREIYAAMGVSEPTAEHPSFLDDRAVRSGRSAAG